MANPANPKMIAIDRILVSKQNRRERLVVVRRLSAKVLSGKQRAARLDYEWQVAVTGLVFGSLLAVLRNLDVPCCRLTPEIQFIFIVSGNHFWNTSRE